MSRLNINNLTNENEDGSPRISGISTFSSAHYFVPPSGTTAERPSDPGEGMIRFNTDSGHLEYYTGEFWDDVIVNNYQIGISTNPAGTSGGLGHRGVFMGGGTPGQTTDMDYITISTFGNAQDFGNLSAANRNGNNGIIASSTRGICATGDSNPTLNGTVFHITFASTGDSTSTGSVYTARRLAAGCSNQTRAIVAGGLDAPTPGVDNNIIECTTIASLGTSEDFGDLTVSRYFSMGCASSTRGIFMGGIDSPTDVSTIDYITISTTGNAQDFGDMVNEGRGLGCASNSTRGILAGGYVNPGANTNTIQFITLATTGNAQDFGDLSSTARRDGSAVASPTRMVVGAGFDGSSFYQALDSIQFLTTGNSLDFGDLVNNAKFRLTGTSNGHGGL